MKELNKIKELFDDFMEEAELLIANSKQIELEDHNFRVNSDNWKKITVYGEEYLENPEKDIWEILGEEARGEQLYTFESMQRETKKAGKTVPTDEQFSEILKEKEDMPNLVLAGFRTTTGSFRYLSSTAYLWSSSQFSSTSALSRYLNSSYSTVLRVDSSKTNGFSVRCIKDNNIII